MKITCESKDAFKPIHLNMVIESKEEAAQLYALFNHTDIASAMNALPAQGICNAIRAGLGGNYPDYQETHQHLCKIIK